MARNIGATDVDAYRAVLVWKRRDNQELVYTYEGLYPKEGTAKGRISFWRGAAKKVLMSEGYPSKVITIMDFYDGWTEQGTITWEKKRD